MNIEPRVGVEQFKLGIRLDDALWAEIGECHPFKRNFMQKNPSLRFPLHRTIVYFDNQNLSAAIEILGDSANFKSTNFIGLSVSEARTLIGGKMKEYSYQDDVLTSSLYGLRLKGIENTWKSERSEQEKNGFRAWNAGIGAVPISARNRRNPYYST